MITFLFFSFADDDENTNAADERAISSPNDAIWNLGCAAYCRDNRSPNYSKVKGKMLACRVNFLCPRNTRYH